FPQTANVPNVPHRLPLHWTSLLRYADPTWTNMLGLSLGAMILACAVQILYAMAFLVLDEFQPFIDHSAPLESANNFSKPLLWLAVVLLGMANPQLPRSKRFLSIRRMMRVAAGISFVFVIFQDVTLGDVPLKYLWELPLNDI